LTNPGCLAGLPTQGNASSQLPITTFPAENDEPSAEHDPYQHSRTSSSLPLQHREEDNHEAASNLFADEAVDGINFAEDEAAEGNHFTEHEAADGIISAENAAETIISATHHVCHC
jgi:hypothetical protein